MKITAKDRQSEPIGLKADGGIDIFPASELAARKAKRDRELAEGDRLAAEAAGQKPGEGNAIREQ